MDFIKQLIYIIIFAFIFFYTTSLILSFFDVSMSEYGNYLFFILALLVFYVILPKKSSDVF